MPFQRMRRTGVVVAGGLLASVYLCPWPASAQSSSKPANPPPWEERVTDWLRRDPFTIRSWPIWKERLKLDLNESNLTGSPGFDAARKFVRSQTDARGNLGRGLDRDGLAWFLLGHSYWLNATNAAGRRTSLEEAEKALRRNRDLEPKFGPAHYYLARTIWRREELDSQTGDNPRRQIERLKEARKELDKTRELDSAWPTLSPIDKAHLALQAQDYADAEKLFVKALKENPETSSLAQQAARAVILNKQRKASRSPAIRPLVEQFPENGVLASWHGYALALDGDFKGAAKELQRARSLGTDPTDIMPATDVRQIENAARTKPRELFLWIMGCFLGFYAVVMAIMAGAGLLLARRTQRPLALDLLGRPPDQLVNQGQVVRTPQERGLTKLYSVALVLSLVLFYASIPFVIGGLVGITGMLFMLSLMIQRNRWNDLAGDILRAGGGGAWAVFKSLFVGFGKGSFGIAKTPKECPRLYEVLTQVAQRVDTEPVDEIYLAPGSSIGVYQEGSGPFGMFGVKRRVLTLGLSTMPFLTISELKSILAHEYAHFSHRDTFFHRFIYQVTLSMQKAMQGMAQAGGWITYVNPFYWFLFLYHKAYILLSAGFSRSREFLADRMACSVYGANVFSSALAKVCTDGTLFEMTIYDNLKKRLEDNKSFVNVYEAFRKFRNDQISAKEREKLYKKLLEEKGSVFATHPTFGERVAAMASLPTAHKSDTTPALQLFEKPEEVEKELTDFLTGHRAQWNRVRIWYDE